MDGQLSSILRDEALVEFVARKRAEQQNRDLKRFPEPFRTIIVILDQPTSDHQVGQRDIPDRLPRNPFQV